MSGTVRRLVAATAAAAIGLTGLACSTRAPGAGISAGPGGETFLATPPGVVWSLARTSNAVLRSTDGGRTWRVVLARPGLSAGYFLSPDDAWVVSQHMHAYGDGETTLVFRTTDGGRHWSHGAPLPHDLTTCCLVVDDRISFADARHGWILGYGPNIKQDPPDTEVMLLWRTADGGHMWTRLPSRALPLQGLSLPGPGGFGSCQPDMVFANANLGWLTEGACHSGRARPEVWRTVNGGSTWRPVALPGSVRGWGDWYARGPSPGWAYLGGVDVGPPRVVGSADRPVVLVPVAVGPSGLLIERSGDGGRTWRPVSELNTGAAPMQSSPADWFDPLNPRQWVISAPGRLIETADGGQTWRFLSSALSLPGVPVAFTSLRTGLVQGSYYVAAVATTDAGRTWTPAPAPPSLAIGPGNYPGPAISMVQMLSSGRAIAAGWAGLETSADGGRTWTPRSAVPGPVGQVASAGGRVVFAVGGGELLRSLDGGVTWSALDQPVAGPVLSVNFWSAAAGVAETEQGRLFLTADAGLHWRPLRVPVGATATTCFTADAAWIVAVRNHRPALLISRDGGHQWQVALGTGVLPRGARTAPGGLQIAGCSGRQAWLIVTQATGPGGTMGPPVTFDLLRTTNLGRSWLDVLRSPSSAPVTRPDVPQPPGGPALTAAAAGSYAVPTLTLTSSTSAWYTILNLAFGGIGFGSTGDAGFRWRGHWFAMPSPSFPPLADWEATSAVNASHAWTLFGSKNGSSDLYSSRDGGATWQRIAVFRPRPG
jgi:photosystem II stability/assembly factor-like uncharacterized protein